MMGVAVALVAVVLGAAPAPTPPSLVDLGAPPCPTTVAHCYGLRIHLAGEAPLADDAAFVKTQLERANGLFAQIDTGFEVASADRLDASDSDGSIETREERDALGHRRWTRGVVDVYIVNRLYDVDKGRDEMGELTEIRGVHWRDRAAREHRWVILWRGSPAHVMAHELGHFFSLPHGTDPASIMNKSPRSDPPPEQRGFVPAELDKMRAAERRMRKSGFLRERKPVAAKPEEERK
ncbi:MAG: hypothetical protein U1F43_26695 [Myxococcota bacterium]